MKTISTILLALFALTHWTNAQTATSGSLATNVGNGRATISDPPYAVVERGANHRVWEKTTDETSPDGQKTPRVYRYTELATGLNYLNAKGEWAESSEQIESYPGGAIARHGQHQVIFANNLNTAGAIDLRTPDGRRLRSQVVGLSYFDVASGRSVLIAEVKDSQGQLYPPNVVVYPDAFTDFKADVRYTYTRAGFEQDIILREKPPGPEVYGLDPATTRLQVLTEFLNSPQPKIRPMPSKARPGDTEDEDLDFGVMQLGQGKAFSLDRGGKDIRVNKQWMRLEGRDFLVEEVALPDLEEELQSLPAVDGASVNRTVGSVRHVVSRQRLLPATPSVQTGTNEMELARLALPSQGLVLDYQTVPVVTNNMTFQGDQTYYVTGPTYLYDTTVFEGGAVIKYAPTNSASLHFNLVNYPVAIVSKGTAYRPTIFTARDDDSVGETIPGSTGTPSTYGGPALSYYDSYGNVMHTGLSHFRISYAGQAISCSAWQSYIDLSDGQFVNCSTCIATSGNGETWNLNNLLFAKFGVFMAACFANIYAQNVTFDGVAYNPPYGGPSMLMVPSGSQYTATLNLNNCILANVTMFTAGNPGTINADHNGFYNCGFDHVSILGTSVIPSLVNPFQTVGAGNYYLTNNCVFHNQGLPTSGLNDKTTYPPSTNAPYQYNANRIWLPIVPRDNNDNPDLGYHYDPIDYLCTSISAQGPFLLTNGVAVAFFGSVGINGGAPMTCVGQADALNHLVWYPSVQEQPLKLGGVSTAGSSLFSTVPTPCVLSFTDIPMLGKRQTLVGQPAWYIMSLKNCQLHGINLAAGAWIQQDRTPGASITLQNCLWERCTISYFNGYSSLGGQGYIFYYQNPFGGYLYNNLFWQSTVGLTYLSAHSQYNLQLNLKDNLSHNSGFTFSGDGNYMNYISVSNNAYDQTPDALPGANDLTVTSLAYANGPLGPWYLGSSTPTLVDAGSRTAAAAGLYHFTTQISEVKEGDTMVDIGFHYVAGNLDYYGDLVPYDSSPWDGIPDYIADANGNGMWDNGEIPWQPVTITTQPVSQTVTAGNDAAFYAAGWASGPHYTWYFDNGKGQGPQTMLYDSGPSSTLYVNSAQKVNEGTYTVNVKDGECDDPSCPTVMSVPATLTVVPALPVAVPSGLVAWWRAEGDPGDVLNQNPATVQGQMTYNQGKVGKGFYLNGNDTALIIPASSSLASSSFTFEAWIYPSNNCCEECVLEQYDPGSGTKLTVSIPKDSGKRWLSVTWVNGGTSYTASSAPGTIREGTFQHVAVTYNATYSVANLRLYVNGQQVGSGWNGVSAGLKGNSNLYLGCNSSLGERLAGRLDEIAIYNRALAASEVLPLYRASTAGKKPPCVAAPADQAGWWEGEGNADDVYALNPGIAAGAVTYTPGWSGNAFTFGGGAAQVRVPASAGLNVGTVPAGFTVEAWVLPSDFTGAQPILEWNNGSFTGVALWISDSGWLFANVRDADLTDNFISGAQMASGIYQHVALIYDEPNHIAHLFLNGVEVGQQICSPTLVPGTTGDLFFGFSPMDDEGMTGTQFKGQIDEVGLYQRPLSAAEVNSLYLAGGGGKCGIAPTVVVQPAAQNAWVGNNVSFTAVATGTALTYQWYHGSTAISGATSRTLTLNNVQTGDSGNYLVHAINALGDVSSSAALVVSSVANNTSPPTITSQPASQTPVCAGSGFTLSVIASGASSYQWCKNGININGATSSSYAGSTATLNDGGIYTVIVYGPQGQVTSANAVVAVYPRPTAVVSGNTTISAGDTASIQAALSGTGPWTVTWSDNVTQSGITQNPLVRAVTPLASRTYTVTALSDANCNAAPGDLSGSAAVIVGAANPPYRTLSGSLTDYTFQGDTTYYINGVVHLHGTTTFEGGAVLKYAKDASLELASLPPPQLKWLATPYRPVIFTAKDDNTVGAVIDGSTGSPDPAGYANPAMKMFNVTATLANLRMAWAQQALVVYGCNSTLAHAQFINCQQGICAQVGTLSLKNALFANLQTCLNRLDGVNVGAQYVTFADSTYLETGDVDGGENGVFVGITNSIMANLTSVFTSDDVFGGNYNGFYKSPVFGDNQNIIPDENPSPFQNIGAGNYYLSDGCAFLNRGRTEFDTDFWATLTNRTTQPPLIVSGTPTEMTWLPRNIRDTDTPDLGYHYDALDYLVSQVTVSESSTLALADGVAVGLFGASGFNLHYSATVTSTGLPQAMNRLVWYPAVQEQSTLLSGVATPGSAIFNVQATGSNPAKIAPIIQLRFTDLAMLGKRQDFYYGGYAIANQINVVSLIDCWLRGVNFKVDVLNALFPPPQLPKVTLGNNLMERSTLYLATGNWPLNYAQQWFAATLYNNLFWHGAMNLYYVGTTTSPPWVLLDNLFDTESLVLSGVYSSSHVTGAKNGSYNTGFPGTDGRPDPLDIVTLTKLNYATGLLGPWYIGDSSPTIVDAGSRLASDAGLYHYTTQVNQVKERTTQVDIGFHYVACNTDQYGDIQPWDTYPWDNLPDYLADANGNGICDPGEMDWGGVTILTQPVPQTVAVGNDAVFQVVATTGYYNAGSIDYQWYFQGVPYGSDQPSLYIQNVQNANGGTYMAFVDNGWIWSAEGYDSQFSNPVKLTVVPAVQVPEPAGMVSWWRGEDDGTDALDSHNDASVEGGMWYDKGKVGKAFYFDGASGDLRVPNSETLDSSSWSGFTLDTWIYPYGDYPNVNSTSEPILEQYDSGSGTRLTVYLSSSGSLNASWVNGGNTYTVSSDPGLVRCGTFQHVAVTYNAGATGDRLCLYLNGKLVGSGMAGVNVALKGSSDLYFGYSSLGTFNYNYLWGALDEMTLYNRALASSEILAIYNASYAGKVPPCTEPPNDMVSWWEGEGNGDDVYALNSATVEGDVTFAPGLVGKAFTFGGDAGQVHVPASDSLNLGAGDEFTVEAWVNPSNAATAQPILEWNTGDFTGVALWLSKAGSLCANIRNMELTDYPIPGRQLTAGVFQHVALVYAVNRDNPAQPTFTATLYLNGENIASRSWDCGMPPLTGCDFYIGFSPIDDEMSDNDPLTGTNFVGQIDEVTVYHRALQASEIKKIYLASTGGKCGIAPTIITPPASQTAYVGNNVAMEVVATGTALTYQWYLNSQPVSGATGRILTLTDLQTIQAGSYTVRVANDVGTVDSAPANLTVNPVPASTTLFPFIKPGGTISVCEGDGFTLNAFAKGIPPFSYQWCKDGINIPGATGSSYTQSASSSADSGVYTVFVCNSSAHNTSQGVTVAVHPHPTGVLTGDASINPGLMTPLMAVLTGSKPWTITIIETPDGQAPITHTYSGITQNPWIHWVAPNVSTTYTWETSPTGLSDANCTALPTGLTGSARVDVSGASWAIPARAGISLLRGSYHDFTFAADQTYYIYDSVYFYGKTTIEGGTVVKFGSVSWAPTGRIIFVENDDYPHAEIVCDTGPYRPAVFGGGDDFDFGYWGVEENDEPTGYYGQGLSFAFTPDSPVTLKNIRFRHLNSGVSVDGPGTYNLYNCQFVECNTAIGQTVNANVNLYNILFTTNAAVFSPTADVTAPHFKFQNITADNCAKFVSSVPIPAGGTWTGDNSLLVAIADPTTIPSFADAHNTCRTLASDVGVFQTEGDGSYYLVDDTYRGKGTVSGIDSMLLTELTQRTTHPPMTIEEWRYFSGSWTFSPQAPRYVAGTAPDLGYHYDALDYTIGGVIAFQDAQIKVLPGTAIGMRFDWWFGFDLWEGSSFISQGTADKPNSFVPVSLVQEGPYPFIFYPGWIVSLIPDDWPYEDYNPQELPPPVLDFRFSNFYLNSGLSYHLFTGMNLWFLFDFCPVTTISSAMNLNLRDCNLHSGWIDMGEPNVFYFWPVDYGGPVIPSSVSWRNTLFDRININLDPDTSDIYWGRDWFPSTTVNMSLVATNNLFRGGYLYLEPVPASAGNWTFENNLFDQTAFAQDPREPLNYDYNAYWGTPQLGIGQLAKLLVTDTKSSYVDGAHDQDLTAQTAEPPYQFGPLGDFYLPNTTPLYGAGHGLPGDVGLYHYTTRIDQTKEGNEPAGHNVNIGLHYVATTGVNSTQPNDFDGDGIPDYVEDANGNGIVDPTETDWTKAVTTAGTPDPQNSIYDDLDLSGDGLIGRIKKLLGMDPLDSSNPLTLKQVITGEEPQFVTFEVPINYDLLTNVASLYLTIDGRNASLAECDPAPDRTCWLKWNTYYDTPGQRYVAAMLIPKQPQSGFGFGPLTSFNSPNIARFYEGCSGFDSGGATLFATIPFYSAGGYSYSIELLDPENTTSPHIKTISGTTSSGVIQEYWDLTYDDNVTKFAGSEVDAVFTISPTTGAYAVNASGSSPGPQTLRLWSRDGLRDGDFDVAYGDNGPEIYLRTEGVFWNQMQGVVDMLLAPRYGLDNYFSQFDQYYYNFSGYPGYIKTRGDALGLLSDLAKNARYFYFYGHGGTFAIASTPYVLDRNNQIIPDTCHLTVNEVADSLKNKINISGNSDYKTPYRFVFLDGCSTAKTPDWQHAFGVLTPPPIASDFTYSWPNQAFIGWEDDIINCGAEDSYDDPYNNYGDTLNYFFADWMNGRTLDQCIQAGCVNFSSPSYIMEHPNGRHLPFAVKGNEQCLLVSGDLYIKYDRVIIASGGQREFGTAKLKLVGNPGLTRTGHVPGNFTGVTEYPQGIPIQY